MQRNNLSNYLWFPEEYFSGAGARVGLSERLYYRAGVYSSDGASDIGFDAGWFTLLSLARDIEASLAQLRTWRSFSDANHAHRVALVEAEMARVQQKKGAALDLYDQAIAAAERGGFRGEQALANELAGRFHHDRGSATMARAYLTEARDLYDRWGATAKRAHLEAQWAELLG